MVGNPQGNAMPDSTVLEKLKFLHSIHVSQVRRLMNLCRMVLPIIDGGHQIQDHLLSHLLIAGCDIGVQISVRPSVRPFVRSSVRPSTFTSKFSFLDIRDSCESETLHSNCP